MDTPQKIMLRIPKEVSQVTSTLEKAGFEAYLVGGCVRDLVMSQISFESDDSQSQNDLNKTEGDREPKDWDVATSAKPEQIISLFEKTIYENDFGTVMVIQEDVSQETLRQIEVTPYRIEAKYTDFRHPDKVKFSDNLGDDLKRRDFTINAMAYRNGYITDIFDGIKDIKDKILRTVGKPDDRFEEDALRMLRAVRIALQLDFSVSYESAESISKNANLIKEISKERIHDEFSKIIMSKNPSVGMVMLQKFGLLKNILPELEEGIKCEQGGEHIYDVWNHLLQAVQHAADKNWPLEIRLAALFHDIGKPKARRLSEPKKRVLRRSRSIFPQGRTLGIQKGPTFSRQKKYTFYGHEVLSARMVKNIMERLKFSKKEIDLVEKLVRNHMFFSDTELITLSAVRRIIKKVGAENIWFLMNVRECDRVGMKKKETPYRLRKYFAMIEEALHDPISVGQLKINGEFMIKKLGIAPSPRMGWILHALLEEILDDPAKNKEEHLSELAKSLNMLGDAELKAMGDRGKEKKEKLEEQEVKNLHTKHGVRK